MSRNLISITAIKRAASAYRSRQRENERRSIIERQSGLIKDLPVEYSLSKIDFDINTRNTKIEILQSQQYRTIERYVTQNYVRYPIYSEWKVRKKTITKAIKLTNTVLESLNKNSDQLIRILSREIIFSLNNENLLPSWIIREALENEKQEKINEITQENNTFRIEKLNENENFKLSINRLCSQIITIENNLKNYEGIKQKIITKLNKIEKAKHSIALAILSLGIRSFLISNKRKTKYKKLLSDINNKIEQEIKLKENTNEDISSTKDKIAQNENLIREKENETRRKFRAIVKEYDVKFEQIEPLPETIETQSDFILLKSFSGFEYKKIIGCYVIRNRENGKVYVGQSKDILKRLRQHFHGTIPNNIIFAEDYYSSQFVNKEDLFEVKIIPCETKDELDFTERQLIQEYSAFDKGYNGTNGNQ